MSIVTEDGTGLINAETYCSVLEADAYHTAFGNESWSYMDEASKEILLRRSTRDLDLLYSFLGSKLNTTQSLQWPRSGAFTGVPIPVKHATAELALTSQTVDVTGLADTTGNISELTEKIDVIQNTVKYFSPTNPNANVLRKVNMLLQNVVSTSVSGLYATVTRG